MDLKRNPPTIHASQFKTRIRSLFFRMNLKLVKNSSKTIDIGCGWGGSLAVNPYFWLVDGDEKCISYLKSIGANAHLVDIAKKLPFDDGFFDNAFTHDVLEHLEEIEMINVFSEARRVLKKGGLFINVVPNCKGFKMGLRPEVGHKRFVSEKEILTVAQLTGFEMLSYYRSPLKSKMGEYFTHNKLVTICAAV